MKQILIILIFLTTLYGCSKTEQFNNTTVKVLFAPNSFEEDSATDDEDEDEDEDEDDDETTEMEEILIYLQNCAGVYGFELEYISPDSYDAGEAQYLSWLESADENTVIVLASNSYDDIMVKNSSYIKSQKIVVCDSDISKTLPVYSYELCSYGASYLVGAMARVWTGESSALYLGAYENDRYKEAYSGFLAGYKELGGKDVYPTYLSTVSENDGENMRDEAYEYAKNNLRSGLCLVYCYAGDSNYGVYDYLNENSEYYAGAENYDEESYSGKIIGAPYKYYGRVTYDYLASVLKGNVSQGYTRYGLSSGYISSAISNNYNSYIYSRVYDYYDEAVDAEKAYLKSL